MSPAESPKRNPDWIGADNRKSQAAFRGHARTLALASGIAEDWSLNRGGSVMPKVSRETASGTELLQFSPTEQLAETERAFEESMAGQQGEEGSS